MQQKILLVDDEQSHLHSLQRTFMDEPYEILTARSAEDALLVLAGSEVDVVISDQNMPGMSGTELMEGISRNRPDTVRIILTGYASLQTAVQAINQCEVYRFLTKPWDQKDLVLTVRQALVQKRLEESNRELTKRLVEMEIGKRKQAELSLETSRRCFHDVVERSKDAICVVNTEGRVRYFNRAAEQIFGVAREAMLGQDFGIPVDEDSVEIDIIGVHGKGGVGDMRSTTTYWLDEPAHLVTVRDITAQKSLERRLTYLAGHDALTGLYNRHRFEEHFGRELEKTKRYGGRGILMAFDLDRFKEVNDRFGHKVGDELLIQVAELLKTRLRKSDICARTGGDEFCILLPDADFAGASELSDILMDLACGLVINVGKHAVSASLSIGMVAFPAQGTTVDELMIYADMAMYDAKNGGGNCKSLYDPDCVSLAAKRRELSLVQKIRQTLQEDAFILYLQPISEIRSRPRRTCYEVLARMDDGNGIIAAGEFLPLAERVGLIRELDRWIIPKALEILRLVHQEDEDVHFSINLSGRSVSDIRLLRYIQDSIAAHGVPASKIIFEITETAVISNMATAEKLIRVLRSQGCRFALDDFGAGFSSLLQLRSLPVDFVKIAGSFCRNLACSEVDQHVVRAIVNVAKALGTRTIAQCVEAPETLVLMEHLGVDLAQGYELGKPGPVSQYFQLSDSYPSDKPKAVTAEEGHA